MKRKTTREILADSCMELAESKRIDKITVAEITANCGLSQTTFYNHFKDKYELIIWIHIQNLSRIMNKIGEEGYVWKDTLLEGFNYFSSMQSFFINALKHTSGQDSFLTGVQKINTDALTAEMKKRLKGEPLSQVMQGIIRFYCFGAVHIMCEWLLEGRKIPPETMAEIFEKSLPEPLREYLMDED